MGIQEYACITRSHSMDFVKIIPLSLLTLCFVILQSVASDRWTCDKRQYVEYGRSAAVSCIFPSDYKGVFWYDSADIFAELVIRRDKQDNGKFITAGAGYSNSTYQIEPDGSLVITNVSNIHDRVFSVSLIEDDRTINNFDVEVVTIYHGDQHHPYLSLCPKSNLCLVTSKEAEELNCTYNNMRPAVTLSWNFSAPQVVSDIKETNTLDGKFTYSSHSSVKVVNGTLKPLLTITCAANGAALNFQPVTSTAVVDITQNSTEEIRTETDQVCAEMNTRVEVECAREQSESTSLLWKRGSISSSLILMFLSDGHVKQVKSMNSTITFSDKGTLTFTNVSIHQEGLYTCVYTDGEEYYSHSLTIIVTESCDTKVTNNVIAIAVVGTGIVVFLVVAFVLFVMYRNMKCAKNLSTSVLEELADTITYWPLGQLRNTAIFEEEVISLLRNVSDEVEKNRKKEDKRVIGGAVAGIAGGAMAIAAPIFPPLAVPLLIGGAVMGAAGAGVNIAPSWDKLKKDKAKSKLVQKPLQNFLLVQKELAETIVLLDFAYKAIRDVHIDSCLKESHKEQIANMMTKARSKQKSKHTTLKNQLSDIHSFTRELLNVITEVLSNESSMLVGSTQWKTNMENAMPLPFQHLHESIKYLVCNEKRNTQVNFLMFVKLLYHPGQGLSNGDDKVGVRCERQAKGNMQAEIVQGGLLVGRAAVNVVDVGEDLVEIGNSVFRIARGVSVAGVLLSTLGIMVDVAFLGSAILDLQKSDKGKLAEALSEVADTMEIMNNIVKELAQERRSQVCCCT